MDANLGPTFWIFAREVAQHVKNLTPTTKLAGAITPFESFHGRKPDLRVIRSFGCVCYAHVNSSARNKHAPTSERGIFVGYDVRRRSYRVLLDGHKKLVVCRSVTFNEGDHVTAAMGGINVQQEVKTVPPAKVDDDSSDEEVIHWGSVQQPATPNVIPMTPPTAQQIQPPPLEKKKSFKALQNEMIQGGLQQLGQSQNCRDCRSSYILTWLFWAFQSMHIL
jgi:hypothetical protein